jgi:LVIVD repeat
VRRGCVCALVTGLLCLPASTWAHLDDVDSHLASADLPGPAWEEFGKLPLGGLPDTTRQQVELPAPADPSPGAFELVGHDPLLSRGMNAALAVHGDYAYIGSRTDGTHLNSGVLVVDVSDPASPEVVSEIGQPNEANIGESSRELRILPQQDLLLVLNHACSELIHRCANPSQTGRSLMPSTIRFYDISGENAANPKLVSAYMPSRSAPQQPHEIFLWTDPEDAGRVLLFMSTPSSDSSSLPGLVITDISRAREGQFEEIGTWKGVIGNPDRDNRLHSLTVSNDGRRAYFAYLGGGFLVADTSDFAEGVPDPEVRLVTPVENRVFWTDPGAHSAIKLWGKPYVLVTDEVYGKLGGVLPAHGCPWGWVRIIDINDETAPAIAAEYRLPSNEPEICASQPPDRDHIGSFSAHNPTLTRNLAFITWHGAGLQAVAIADPTQPRSAAQFIPAPLDSVQTEDPALSQGRDKVVMWSFPIIKDGLIYAVDIRNGLYILRYHGPFERQVARIGFLDGNSNSGDATRLE